MTDHAVPGRVFASLAWDAFEVVDENRRSSNTLPGVLPPVEEEERVTRPAGGTGSPS